MPQPVVSIGPDATVHVLRSDDTLFQSPTGTTTITGAELHTHLVDDTLEVAIFHPRGPELYRGSRFAKSSILHSLSP